ncbi:AMP-binding protein [Micromonospora sp. DT48]|uniref:AMP-binding protein n=1 Tax=unclassified Micromonospora TaxID=2617518 RepID=UPI0012BCD712|nr:AMP-binding protein [Micromonospora sp. CP22]MTK03403.1 D-alanine--poly(phosphoribitol) ligase [Micromonospora sp. CP22]
MSPTPAMYEWFGATVRAHPTRTALSVAGADFTYAELDAAAGRAAAAIAGTAGDRTGRPPRRIGVLASRTVAATYVAYLASLRLGDTVICLNTEFPPVRNAEIARLAGLDVLVHADAERELAAQVRAATGVRLLSMPDDAATFTGDGPSVEAGTPDVDDLAYIIFTSGSTGSPKGVPIRHRNFAAWVGHFVPMFADRAGARVAQTADLSWDMSMIPLWTAWASGGTVVVPTKTDLLAPAKFIAGQGITHWVSTPASVTMARWLGDLTTGGLPDLRWSIFGGEALTPEHVRAWREAAPNSAVANVYGPSEATVTCLTHLLPQDPTEQPATPNGTVPIGRVYPTVEYVVLDDDGTAADEGELLVRGPQRFDGYLDPAHNRGRFVLWDGELLGTHDGPGRPDERHWYRTGDRVRFDDAVAVYLGRVDNQVKVHGYRIEPGDIEAALRAHPGLEEAAVVPCPADDGIVELAGFFTGEAVSDPELRDFLAGRLPTYMTPRFLVHVAKLPLSLNGKIDRKALVAQAASLTTTS